MFSVSRETPVNWMLINLPSYGIQGAVNGDRVGSARCRDGEESCMFTFTCSHARYQFTDNAMHVPVAICMRIRERSQMMSR